MNISGEHGKVKLLNNNSKLFSALYALKSNGKLNYNKIMHKSAGTGLVLYSVQVRKNCSSSTKFLDLLSVLVITVFIHNRQVVSISPFSFQHSLNSFFIYIKYVQLTVLSNNTNGQ